MRDEVYILIETFPALPARIGPLARVDFPVFHEGRSLAEAFPAVAARVGFLARVGSPMSH